MQAEARAGWAQEVYRKLVVKMQAECARVGGKIPYIPQDGRYQDLPMPEGIDWWTNGFWAGILWQMYHATGDDAYRAAAQQVEQRLDEALYGFEGLHHDVGFMWLHSAVADYRLTGRAESRRRGLHAANLLAGRYNPRGRFIRAWNLDRTGWIIVDCMMNIPLLYWAAEETGDPRFRYIAMDHADTCRRVTVRPDGSCNHISILNPENGEVVENPGGQGYAAGSSWSRGQAWAIYGFALSYRHTGEERYLHTAMQVANYCIANVAQTGWLALVDFRAPVQPEKFDATAGPIAACGMLELAGHLPEEQGRMYADAAVRILQATDRAFCDWDPGRDALVAHGASAYHAEGRPDADAPIIYGDYFFIEGVLRLLGKDFLIW